ncbi:MAG: ribonuclease G [Nevskiaceae bacterium]|jgi:ribonuclease G|nr:ribonuclease G [Nevskiaceae bacterium]
MSFEILLNASPRECRAALLDNGVLQEVFIERASRRGLVSNLYKGRVSRVLPGMQAAFLDVGLARTAFLHVADILGPPPELGSDTPPESTDRAADVRSLVREGDELLVQVVKDPIGTKGARLSTHVSLPSRFLVYLPRGSKVGVSARIESETERARLRELVTMLAASQQRSGVPEGGYIVRTAAMGAPLEALHADMLYLQRLWTHVRERAVMLPSGSLVHEDLPLSLRVLRDELRPEVRRVLVDSAAEYARICDFTRAFMPDYTDRLELYQGSRPIFDLHGVEEEIRRALEPRVALKSGGHIVIQQTEAMTTVDVNTGGYVGHRNLEETIFRTNLEAAVAVARQLRIRNLGGIIVLDFIDMQEPEHQEALLLALQEALAGDRAQTHISSVSPLGLVEMTRKRTRESLEHLLCGACPQCAGRGYVRTAETVCHEIYRELMRQSRQFASSELLVLAHPDVVARLLEEEAPVLAELETQLVRPIRLQSEPLYGIDQYDVVPA